MEHSQNIEQPLPLLPPEVQKYVDAFLDRVISIEKEGYESKLIPFAQHADELRIRAQEYFSALHLKLRFAQNVLKERFAKQEEENPKISNDTKFQVLELAQETMRHKLQDPAFSFEAIDTVKPLQEQLELPWAFMDRAYQTAHQLLREKQYAEAESVYILLCFLHPGVFEFWFCSASCKEELGKLEEAIETYTMSLLWEPTNPLVYFQIASCHHQAKDTANSLQALDTCIQYAQENETLLQQAKAAYQTIKCPA